MPNVFKLFSVIDHGYICLLFSRYDLSLKTLGFSMSHGNFISEKVKSACCQKTNWKKNGHSFFYKNKQYFYFFNLHLSVSLYPFSMGAVNENELFLLHLRMVGTIVSLDLFLLNNRDCRIQRATIIFFFQQSRRRQVTANCY